MCIIISYISRDTFHWPYVRDEVLKHLIYYYRYLRPTWYNISVILIIVKYYYEK